MNDLAPAPARHKLDVDDFFRMFETGIVPPGDRGELVDKALIDMAPIGTEHAGALTQLNEMLSNACHRRAVVSVHNPVRFASGPGPQGGPKSG